MQQLTGKKKFILKATKEKNEKPQPTIHETVSEEISPGTGEKKPKININDLTYSQRLTAAKEILLDSFLKNEDGSLSTKKIDFLVEHLKFKKPDIAVGIIVDLLKIEQKDQDLIARNKNYGQEKKAPAPILIQINNNIPGSEQTSQNQILSESQVLGGDLVESIAETQEIQKIGFEPSKEEIEQIVGPKPPEIIKREELREFKQKIRNLPESEKKDFFSQIQNQEKFLSLIS